MGSRRVVETLTRTGGFGVNVTRHRLLETFQHILQVTRSLASVAGPDGAGFASSLRVRLLHAAVRRRILALAARRPAYYSVADHGVPVNALDCVGTIAAFSAALVWVGLPRQGVVPRPREAADLVARTHLWFYTPMRHFRRTSLSCSGFAPDPFSVSDILTLAQSGAGWPTCSAPRRPSSPRRPSTSR